MRDLRNVSSAYAMPGISSSATLGKYGQVTVGPSSSGGERDLVFLVEGGPRLSFDTSDGSEVNSVLGVVFALVAERDNVGAEEVSVNGDGGVVA
jgi:hypothetical protein